MQEIQKYTIKDNELHVTGRGVKRVMADRMSVDLSVIKENKETRVINEALAETTRELIDLLENQTQRRAERIHTKDMTIEPVYKKQTKEEIEAEKERVLVGYRGRFVLSFESIVEHAGMITSLLLDTGKVDEIENIRFIVGEELKISATRETLRMAALDARQKGMIVLNTMGLGFDEITEIIIEDGNGHIYEENARDFNAARMAMAKPKKNLIRFIANEHEIKSTIRMTMTYS